MTTVPVATKPARNRLGVSALVVVLVAVVLPGLLGIVGFIATIAGPAQTQDTVGWGILGGLVIAGLGLGIAGPVALIGVILAIIALLRKGFGKVAAIVALVIGAPLAIVGMLVLPTFVGQMF